MKRKNLITIMAVILIMAVYIAMYVLLPRNKTVNGEGNITQDSTKSGQESGEKHIDLTQKVVVLDSGHGGFDPGKKSSSGILEKDINLAIANKLKVLLEEKGIKVVMTRTDDNGLYSESDSNKKVADMKKRCAIIDDCKADIVVSIHQNSFQSAQISGAQVFYYKHSAAGKKLARTIQESFKQNLDNNNRRVEKEDTTYYMLVHTSVPTVIAECGFLSNPEEAEKLASDEYQDKVANALYQGIITYFMDT